LLRSKLQIQIVESRVQTILGQGEMQRLRHLSLRLAARTGVPLVTGFAVREGDGWRGELQSPIMPAPDTTEDRALEALANGNWWGHWDLVKWTESYNVRDAIRRLEAKGWCFERGWSVSPRSGKEFRRWRLTAGSASGTGIGSRGCDGVNRSPRHPFGAQ